MTVGPRSISGQLPVNGQPTIIGQLKPIEKQACIKTFHVMYKFVQYRNQFRNWGVITKNLIDVVFIQNNLLILNITSIHVTNGR